MKAIKKIFNTITVKENIEFGLVLVVLAAFLAIYKKQQYYLIAVFALSLVTLIAPIILYPFTVFWFALGKILNAVSSRVLLTVIFIVIVTPVGLIRRISGKDGLKTKRFKKARKSVMITRNHLYVPEDLKHTF